MYIIRTTKTKDPRYLMRDSTHHVSMWSYQIERATKFETVEEATLAIAAYTEGVPCETVEIE